MRVDVLQFAATQHLFLAVSCMHTHTQDCCHTEQGPSCVVHIHMRRGFREAWCMRDAGLAE